MKGYQKEFLIEFVNSVLKGNVTVTTEKELDEINISNNSYSSASESYSISDVKECLKNLQ